MGLPFSRPVAAAPLPTPLPTLTIRNVTATPLNLKLVERLERHAHPHLHNAKELVKVTSQVRGRPQSRHASDSSSPRSSSVRGEQKQPPSARGEPTDLPIQPFSECRTNVYLPDPAHHEQLRLTFEDPSTGHLYSAEIPGPSRRSIVLRSHAQGPEEETKEFTAIYLPSHAYLALFSSANLANWMSTLDPSLPLSCLSIPGTHNSPTYHVALPSVRCQAVSVLDQLNNGVRFLDVRVSTPVFRAAPPPPPPPTLPSTPDQPDNTYNATHTHAPTPTPELSLVHSVFPVSLTGPKHLSSLLSTVHAFLSAHPTETVLLSLKREGPPGPGRGTDADLSQILHEHYIRPHPGRWYTGAEIPTLREARGRIVLVRRFRLHPSIPASERGGIDGSVWPDNVADGTCGGGTIRIQDYYGVSGAGEIPRKVRYAQEGLERAAAAATAGQGGVVTAARDPQNGRNLSAAPATSTPAQTTTAIPPPPLFINFLSASSFFNVSCWPDRIAHKINPSMIEYLCMHHGTPREGTGTHDTGDAATGIVVTDWVGYHGDWDIVRCIVGWNARLQLRQ